MGGISKWQANRAADARMAQQTYDAAWADGNPFNDGTPATTPVAPSADSVSDNQPETSQNPIVGSGFDAIYAGSGLGLSGPMQQSQSVTSGDVGRSNAIDVSSPSFSSGDRRNRIDKINALTPDSKPLPYDIADDELKGWEATYATALAGGPPNDAQSLDSIQVVGQRETSPSWENAYGVGNLGTIPWRMTGAVDDSGWPKGAAAIAQARGWPRSANLGNSLKYASSATQIGLGSTLFYGGLATCVETVGAGCVVAIVGGGITVANGIQEGRTAFTGKEHDTVFEAAGRAAAGENGAKVGSGADFLWSSFDGGKAELDIAQSLYSGEKIGAKPIVEFLDAAYGLWKSPITNVPQFPVPPQPPVSPTQDNHP